MQLSTTKSKLPKSVKRITILKSASSPGTSDGRAHIVIKQKRKKKKQSKGIIKIWERVARRAARANQTTAADYLSRHRRANKKRRDGWLRDYGYNWMRAQRKGRKKFKLLKIIG